MTRPRNIISGKDHMPVLQSVSEFRVKVVLPCIANKQNVFENNEKNKKKNKKTKNKKKKKKKKQF